MVIKKYSDLRNKVGSLYGAMSFQALTQEADHFKMSTIAIQEIKWIGEGIIESEELVLYQGKSHCYYIRTVLGS